ncbi:unnamed protein product [Cylicostephanus goldi]|uniref:Amino acid transporter transmembrane domain-containing protein n=1 Tax=Cylicostephanus goldi TaxID=71465 RepID=A0A3P6RUF7_CYLGO|nr:unnamed protein product [Cylicostephanus goldi]
MPNISVVDFTYDDETARKRPQDRVENASAKKKGLSAHLTLINFLKGMIGPGCFSLPLAFREAGLWVRMFDS